MIVSRLAASNVTRKIFEWSFIALLLMPFQLFGSISQDPRGEPLAKIFLASACL
jgi:hypothetical protein